LALKLTMLMELTKLLYLVFARKRQSSALAGSNTHRVFALLLSTWKTVVSA